MNDEELSRALKAALPRYEAPSELTAKIRSALASDHVVPNRRWRRWSLAAASLILVAAGSSALTVLALRSRDDSAATSVVASHIRSLVPGHLTDVTSTNQHNVKPWFNGRVNVSPPVPKLDSLGFPLVGGRVDYIDAHAVAAVVYTRREHVINVFAWPVSGERDVPATLTATLNGYHLEHARRDGLELWFVSDLNVPELEEFVQRYLTAR